MKAHLCNLVPLLLLVLLNQLTAQTTVQARWLGGDGNWSNNSLWNTGVAPNNNASHVYNVSANPTATSNVTLDQNATVSSLTLASHAQFSTNVGYSLTVGRLNNQGMLTNCSPRDWGVNCSDNNVAINNLRNSGAVQNYGMLTINGDARNSGSWSDGSDYDSDYLENYAQSNVRGTFNNSGSYDAYKAALSVGGTVRNSGVIGLDGGGSLAATSLINADKAILSLNGGAIANELQISGNFTNHGTFGSFWSFTSIGGNVVNTGRMDFGTFDGFTVGGNFHNSGSISSMIMSDFEIAGRMNNSGDIVLSLSNFWSPGIASFGSLVNSGNLYVGDLDYAPSDGTLIISGAVQNSGKIQIPYYTQNGTYFEQFLSTTQFGTFTSEGLTLGGPLSFIYGQEFTPQLGETFDIFSFNPGELNGAFSSLRNNRFNNGDWMFDIDYDNADGKIYLTVVDAPERTPEPSTWALILVGFSALVIKRLRFRSAERLAAISPRAYLPVVASGLFLFGVVLHVNADTFGVTAFANASAEGNGNGELVTDSNTHTSHHLPKATATAIAGVSVNLATPPQQFYVGAAGAQGYATTTLGHSTLSADAIGYTDVAGKANGNVYAEWFDTFYALEDTTFVLTAVLNDYRAINCYPGYYEVPCFGINLQYQLQVTALSSSITLDDLNFNYHDSGICEIGDYCVEGSSRNIVTSTFFVPSGESFVIDSRLLADATNAGGDCCTTNQSGVVNASALLQLKTTSGAYITASGVSYVPEPSCLLLFISGVAGTMLAVRRKRHR